MLAAAPAGAKQPKVSDAPAGHEAASTVSSSKGKGGATEVRGTAKAKGNGNSNGNADGKSNAGGTGNGKAKRDKTGTDKGGGTAGGQGPPTTTGPVAGTATATTTASPLPTIAPSPTLGSSPAGAALAPTRGRGGRTSSGSATVAGGIRRDGAASAAPSATTFGASARPAARTAAPRRRHAAAAARNPLSSVGRSIPLPLPVPDWSKPIILALVALALFFAMRARLASSRARRLERQRQQLLADVGLLQAALLPEIPERVGDLSTSVAYRPADGPGAGGDFYDVFGFSGGRVAIIVGDVSGHGREALARATLMRYTLRAYAEARLEPREALNLAEQVLGTDGHGGKEVSGEFTTVAMAVYDPAAATLTYALAGHPAPILTGAPGPEPAAAGHAPPIGWGMPTGQRQTTVTLPAGASACFFTDGLTDARAGGRLLGRERVAAELAAGDGTRSAGALLERMVAAADYTPDDMAACVIGAQHDVPGPAVRVEELVVGPDEADGAAPARFLASCGVGERDSALALHSVRRMARERDGAIVYVHMNGTGPSVKVAGVGGEPIDGAPLRLVEPAASRLAS